MRKHVAVVAVVIVSLAAVLVLRLHLAGAEPLPSGTVVTLFLPTNGNLPEPDPGPPTDKLVFTGGKVVESSLPGCSDSAMPLQNAVLVDPGSQRSGRIISVFISIADSVPPGTRLTGFNGSGNCISDGVTYRKYTATAE